LKDKNFRLDCTLEEGTVSVLSTAVFTVLSTIPAPNMYFFFTD